MDHSQVDAGELEKYLAISSAQHDHLCPRQVLGVRLALAGVNALGLERPRSDKRLRVFIESDGCFADGVAAVTGCAVGHRTLWVQDFGKAALTVVDTLIGSSLRVHPQAGVRQRAQAFAPEAKNTYAAMLLGYQRMPDAELLIIQAVELRSPLPAWISQPG
ncbi:MAG TPA: FmdE family protein, partial [Anaerolineales bacterium]